MTPEDAERPTGSLAVPRRTRRPHLTQIRESVACTESSDSSCEQQQLADGRQPCRDADTAKFDGRRVKNGRRGERER